MGEFDDILKNNSDFGNDRELEKFLSKMEKLKVPAKKSKDAAWNELTDKIEQKKTLPESRTIRLRPMFYAAAASVLILISSWFIFNYINNSVVSVPYGETAYLILPDKSEVTLNSGSSIEYKKWGFRKNRNVNLQGEAFFNVTDGNSFTVLTNQKSIEVLGTSFNVFSRDNKFRVQCITGTIKVEIPGTKAIVLDKGNGVKYDLENKAPEIINVDTATVTSWMNGEFYFESVPVKDVLKEIERQFNVTIQYNNIENRVYTGYFKNDSLESALENVCLPMSLHFEISGKSVKIW